MYSVVLATMLAMGSDAPTFGHHRGHGHHGHHHGGGCHGYAFGCHGCHGCHGCWGGSCHGCYGGSCHGCFGGCSGFSYGCHGCGGGCSGFSYGCHGCGGGFSYGCGGGFSYGCGGCCGGGFSYGCCGGGCCGGIVSSGSVVVTAPSATTYGAVAPTVPNPNTSLTPQEVDLLRRLLRQAEKKDPKTSSNVATTGEVARVTIKLPADARLWIDHVECPLTSAVRSFNTPTLEPGQTYVYTMRVEVNRDGETVRDSQRVRVAAGQQVNVDFSEVDRTATASR